MAFKLMQDFETTVTESEELSVVATEAASQLGRPVKRQDMFALFNGGLELPCGSYLHIDNAE